MRKIHLALISLIMFFLAANSQLIAKVGASPPSTSNLNALVMLSSSNGWAVGDSGAILHFDGSNWNLIPSGTTSDLMGLSFGLPGALNANAGFAVGGGAGPAIAMFWGGVGWFNISNGLSSPGAQKLASVSAVDSNDAWAVDSLSGGFWHWSGAPGMGGGWSLASSASAGLNSVFMTSSIDGWAVGVGGIIYHYAGGGWTVFSAVGGTLNSVFMVNANEGWAVGNGGAIYHYSAGSWTGPVSPGSTNQDLKSVFMLSPTEGWAVGTSGAVVHFVSGVWTAVPSNLLPTNQNLNAVYFLNGNGWAVGDLGTIALLGGQPSQGAPAASLQSVYLTSEIDGWVVGCSSGGCGTGVGEPTIAHWDGTSFTRGTVLAQTSDLFSVFMTSSAEGWAVGGLGSVPEILHYSGGTWTQIPAPSGGYVLRSVFMIDSNNGWAVGDSGVILHYSGGSWGAVPAPTTNTLRSVFMVDASDGWAVGDAGTILRYQGVSGQWFKMPGSTSARLNAVFLSDSSHGWAVGAGGIILHYDGTMWINVADSVSTNLNSIFQVNPQEAWSVGDSGTILHWTGIGWYQVTPSPSLVGTPDLNCIFLSSTGFGFIVGAAPASGGQATILRVGQRTINPIPELPLTQFTLTAIFLTALALVSRIRKQIPKREAPAEEQGSNGILAEKGEVSPRYC